LQARQAPSPFILKAVQGALAQPLAHPSDVHPEELGGFRSR
jgi:hypothetical protein